MPENNQNQKETTFLPESPDTPSFGPPPQMDIPAEYPGEEEPILPTPSLPSGTQGGGTPSEPGASDTNRPSRPITIYPVPIIPRPPQNHRQSYCHIRFLHAAVGYGPVNISIGTKPLAHRLAYGEASSYFMENTGFRSISVSESGDRNDIVSREIFLFNENAVYTITLVNSINGISMFLVSDLPCQNQRMNFSCVRAVDLSYNAPALDVTIQSNMTRFEDLRFKTVSGYRQVMRGRQEFYVSETENGAYVLNVTETLGARNIYTLYLLGDAYVYPGLSAVLTEDSSLIS